MQMDAKLFFVILSIVTGVFGANILYVAPIPSPSHHIWNKALALGLVERGHNLTMLTNEKESVLPENFTLLTMEGIYDIIFEKFDMEGMGDDTVLEDILILYEYSLFYCEYDLKTSTLQTLLNYPKDYKFDLIIFDSSLGRCFYPLIERFQNPPVVGVTPFLLPPVLGTVFGKHHYTAYMPYHCTKYTNKMNLGERILNFIYTYLDILYRHYVFLPQENALIRDTFGKSESEIDALERKIGLLLANTDPILEYPEALPPNIIPVGGLHTRPPKPLPKDLQKILDEAKDGAILFSLGTNLRSDKLDLASRKGLLDAFAKLPQVVLWKFETDMTDLPKNVFIRKWLPQNDILGHPNTRLFINHGGALSTQEAMFHGVPVVGVPFFIDQHSNVRKMVEKGIAKRLDKDNLTMENVYGTIEEVLTSTKYRDNSQLLLKRYRDRPETALERAVFWIEHVLRHGDAEHLVSVSRDMPTYQSINLDVFIVLALGIALLYSFLLLLITLFRFCVTVKH